MLRDTTKELVESGGSAFIDIQICKGIRIDLHPLKLTNKELKQNFMKQSTGEA